MSAMAEARRPSIDLRTFIIVLGVAAALICLAWVLDEAGRPKWESSGTPGRDGESPPRPPTAEEQAETARRVPGPKPLPKDAEPVGKDSSKFI